MFTDTINDKLDPENTRKLSESIDDHQFTQVH